MFATAVTIDKPHSIQDITLDTPPQAHFQADFLGNTESANANSADRRMYGIVGIMSLPLF